MTKTEFLETLRTKLSGEVPASEIEHTIRYYDEYIAEAVSNGKTEQEVLDELGSPLLIARTIIDTVDMQRENTGNHIYGAASEGQPEMKFHFVDLGSWTVILGIILVIVVILALILAILRVILPILIPLFAIWLIITIIRNGGSR